MPSSTLPKAPIKSKVSSTNELALSFDASLSLDCDGTIVIYTWSFGDTSTGSGVKADHTYSVPGIYTVQLTIFDNNGNGDIISQKLTVGTINVPPKADFTVSPNGLTVNVNGAASSDSDGTISSYAWNWNDSTTAGSGVSASHTYTQAGTYQITLTVTDNKAATAIANQTVILTRPNVPPTASFYWSTNLLVANFNGSASSDSDGTIA